MAGESNGTCAQVVVVGAGPVGLMLAGELRLGGADVIVLEQLNAPTTESRASTLHARTMEVLDSRSLLEKVGTPPNDIMGHFGGLPLDLTLPSPYPGQWKVPQNVLEQLLQEWAVSLGADIRRGHEVTNVAAGANDVAIDSTGPEGSARFTAQYVVGCDGENSTVRRLIGAEFPDKPSAAEQGAERVLIRADVAGITIPNRRFQRLEKGLAIAARRGDGVTRVMVHEFGTTSQRGTSQVGFNAIADAWMRVTGEDIRGGTPLWVNSFGDASRQLTQYREGRILFAGDAAHRQMPIGGQALNLGLQDAVNLGWKLALAVRGHASADLLDTYHAERHRVGDAVLSNIRAQAMLLLGGPEVESLRSLIGKLMAHSDVCVELAAMISALDIRYDVGPEGHPLLGVRLPHTELHVALAATSSTNLLRSGRGLLLVLSDDQAAAAQLQTAAASWKARVDVVEAKLASGNPSLETDALLIRPDGYVAWTGADSNDLTAALHRWFGAPATPI